MAGADFEPWNKFEVAGETRTTSGYSSAAKDRRTGISLKGWRRIIAIALFLGAASCAQQPLDSAPSLTPRTFDTFEQRIRVVPVPGLARPWALAFLPGGDILITERAGRLRIVRKGVLDPQSISGIPAVVDLRLKGLNDIAVHPNFAVNKLVYFTYYKPTPGSMNVGTATLARGRLAAEVERSADSCFLRAREASDANRRTV
jgi:glucose/arabinose dehydrogenase